MGAGEITGLQGRTWDAEDLITLKIQAAEKATFASWAGGWFLTVFDYLWGFKHKV
jgi:hypothetical protein